MTVRRPVHVHLNLGLRRRLRLGRLDDDGRHHRRDAVTHETAREKSQVRVEQDAKAVKTETKLPRVNNVDKMPRQRQNYIRIAYPAPDWGLIHNTTDLGLGAI